MKNIIVIVALLVLLGIGATLYYGKNDKKSEKVYRVGILSALDYFSPVIDGFKKKMTELGYVEGVSITYDIQKAPNPVGNKEIIKKFVKDKVDLILVFPTEASLETKEVTIGTNIPVISVAAAVEENNLVSSVKNPGGNITGIRFPIPEVATKRLEILHEIVPKAKRIMVPYLKDYPTVSPSLKAIRPIAENLGVVLVEAPFSTPDEVTQYLDKHKNSNDIDAVLTIPEPVSIIPPFIEQVYKFSDTKKIPVAGAVILDQDYGPVFSLIPGGFEMGELAAPLANKIFKGTNPGTIPIVTPESKLEINYKVVKKLNLKISEGLLSNAEKIVH